jgi:hypothetical protein
MDNLQERAAAVEYVGAIWILQFRALFGAHAADD